MTKQPWWRSDDYSNEESLAEDFYFATAGPKGPALVKVWPDGRTDPGWGMVPGKNQGENAHFMPKYMKDEFNAKRVLFGFERGKWAYAVVMRSVRLICIDIDGKNGGLEHVKKLGLLPPTLAETSKSGDGYHLFYLVPDTWDAVAGFDGFADHIGIEQGVDIRSVGCVYHHKQQRWNHRQAVPLPEHMKDLMLARRQRQVSAHDRIVKVLEGDDMDEMLMLQDELIADLKKPIAPGKRNNTLFAIGQKLKQANVPDYQDHISERAHAVGLDTAEIEQLLKNIATYN